MKNVILFTIDTMRKDVFGCYGNKERLTPFFDSLQDKMIIFNRAYSVGPYTQASFPGILTSSYYLEYDEMPKPQFPPQRIIVSELLRNAGIYTAGFHSNPYLCSFFGWDRGWDIYYDSMDDEVDDINPYIKGNVINEKVNEWLSKHIVSKDYKPFFLWVHYMDVHEPYVPDLKYREMLDSSLTSLAVADMVNLFKEVVLKRDTSNPEKVELARKLYKAHVMEIDEYAKELFGLFEKHDILKDSILIITSDHGDEFGEHGGLSHDGKMYQELVNVPFMIYDPSISEKQILENEVSGVDIPPTILKLFGIEKPANYKGNAILPITEYPNAGCYGEAIGKLENKIKPTDRPTYFFVKDDIKVIYRAGTYTWELYNLKNDPAEKNNIIDIYPLAKEYRNKLNDFINRNRNGL